MKREGVASEVAIAVPISRPADFVALTKPRIVFMILVTTLVGFLMGATGSLVTMALLHVLVGTALVCAGSATLNQYLERDRDALMSRTSDRPLPAGRIEPGVALAYGVFLSVIGVIWLLVLVNLLTTILAVLTGLIYVAIYTPMKLRSSWSILAGAVCGSLPPVMGWTAARGTLDLGAGVLFLILLMWQLPHFLAIALLHREDYARAGFAVATLARDNGALLARQIPFYTLVLVPAAILPYFLGLAEMNYLVGSGLLSVGFLAVAVLGTRRTDLTGYARQVFHASLVYLPILLIWMAANRTL
ncbi:MAG: heme o synthase [Candidatus Zixiibacteriota bacterium]